MTNVRKFYSPYIMWILDADENIALDRREKKNGEKSAESFVDDIR